MEILHKEAKAFPEIETFNTKIHRLIFEIGCNFSLGV
jgi:hypothetical protein